MASAYDKLRRILSLERDQNYRDRAVIGGLARFLTYWEKEARQEAEHARFPITADEVLSVLARYAEQPPAARREAIDRLLGLLAGPPLKPSTSAPEPETVPPAPAARAAEPPAMVRSPDAISAQGPVARQAQQGRAPSKVEQGTLDSPVTTLRGISAAIASRLAKLGIRTIRDLLYHFPRRFDDFSNLKTISHLWLGDETTIVGRIVETKAQQTRSGQTIVRAVVADGTGSIEATWFGQPYLERRLSPGTEIVLSGRVEEYLGRLVFTSPEWELLQRELLHTARLVPVYPLTEGISARWLRRLLKNTLDLWTPRIADPLPPAVIESAGLQDLGGALFQMHFPKDKAALDRARQRLCFDELFLLQLGILRQRRSWRAQPAQPVRISKEDAQAFSERLPFKLTGAQQRAIAGVLEDLQQPVPMSRLLQGDVGSGKTVVAVVAALAAARSGFQAAVMAPTAILAEQHYHTISRMLEGFPDVRCALLVGSLPTSEKERLHEEITQGNVKVVVGTHALIQEATEFANLGLVVVDEQHRFGVGQRTALRAKGTDFQPHLLAMSATPIPRTLALTIYGDLDVSVLDEMPPNRQQVVTAARDKGGREGIYSFIEQQVKQGHQAFVICPLIEESDKLDAKAAVAEYEHLQQKVYPHLRVALLHGRMGADEKEKVMADFKGGLYDILVSTAVVEVGIDVPNATVILVEGAERFGLAQLHQFRGRVGRGEFKSYCILLSDDPSPECLNRLQIMEQTHDGFVLAEKDLEMRGPGDFFGVRQSGLPTLRVARLSDVAILEKARTQALKLFETDPELVAAEHQALAASVRRFWTTQDLS